MFIELVDVFRCIRPHDQMALVLAADRTTGRDVVEGVLGCPTCQTRYPIRGGVADFRDDPQSPFSSPSSSPPPVTDEVVRLAALLGLADPGGIIVLAGTWAGMAHDLLDLVDGVQVIVLDAPAATASGGGISPVRTGTVLPLGGAKVRGFAVDESGGRASLVDQAASALVSGGRLLAPAHTRLPDGMRELARDDRHWVAAREKSAGPVLQLERVRR